MIVELQKITVDGNKRGGKPCMRGLRIMVEDVLGMLAAGMNCGEMLCDFPELGEADILACLAFDEGSV